MSAVVSYIDEMLDVTAPDYVEIVVSHDERKVWINVDGRCLLRACRIQHIKIEDGRKKKR